MERKSTCSHPLKPAIKKVTDQWSVADGKGKKTKRVVKRIVREIWPDLAVALYELCSAEALSQCDETQATITIYITNYRSLL